MPQLSQAADSAIDNAISGKSPGSSTQQISSASNFLKVAGVDLTFIATTGNPSLVSPSHVINAWHDKAFTSLVFTDNLGNTYSRTATYAQVGTTDIAVGTLNSALPSAIKPIAVLPADFRDYLPDLSDGVAVAYSTQDKKIFVGEWTQANLGSEMGVDVPLVTARIPWEQSLRDGDSGSGCFAVVGTTPALLTSWHTQETGAMLGTGPTLSDYITEINALMGVESLSQLDLSGFDASDPPSPPPPSPPTMPKTTNWKSILTAVWELAGNWDNGVPVDGDSIGFLNTATVVPNAAISAVTLNLVNTSGFQGDMLDSDGTGWTSKINAANLILGSPDNTFEHDWAGEVDTFNSLGFSRVTSFATVSTAANVKGNSIFDNSLGNTSGSAAIIELYGPAAGYQDQANNIVNAADPNTPPPNKVVEGYQYGYDLSMTGTAPAGGGGGGTSGGFNLLRRR